VVKFSSPFGERICEWKKKRKFKKEKIKEKSVEI
jgi:hypothetical protein